MKRLRRHRAIALAAAAAALVAATAATASPSSASPTSTPRPTDHAKGAGIARGGDAYMGWSQDSTGRTEPTAQQAARASSLAAATQTPGIDVSKWQGNVDWASYWGQGKKFAYIKATEGTTYQNPYFAQQYNGSYGVGMVRGSYHFALPDNSSGTAQADWFVDHGGAWSGDGKTLPGVLDIEYNPYGATCYGLSQASMNSWIAAFTSRYKARTGRDAVIYSTTSWWSTCTGNTSQFASTNPLWIARYNTTVGTLPAGWSYYTFWQYSDTPVDQDYFNGDLAGLQRLALG
ncbi:lysozyme [Phycicoccus sp. Root101]|uniref:lysozyme n=1 Tax=Phycicoccus sp. Root101 TaxID=1736421 RepID=UPI0007027224|nr:lysozyme [Phycicoccus sp. Root101]KQU66391.1 lysozyme [Phycicoccus sp. Root101]